MSAPTNLTTYYCEYEILPDHETREICLTLFGGMEDDDDLNDLKDVTLLGRWSCVGEARGYCIVQAQNSNCLQVWLNNWVTMADVKVMPCLDDNQHRELILGKTPDYTVNYEKVADEAKENECLYHIKYQFKNGQNQVGFDAFAKLTESEDQADSGKCTPYGRWHIPSLGCGYAIASAPSALDIYKWAYNWRDLCECHITPVTTDFITRSIIRDGLGFKKKHAELLQNLAELREDDEEDEYDGPCVVTAKFTFSSLANKEKFMIIMSGQEGIQLTRDWPGCLSIRCYDSQENDLEFTIRQKWEKSSNHAAYMEMRKETGLFDEVTEMLSCPLEITHHTELDL